MAKLRFSAFCSKKGVVESKKTVEIAQLWQHNRGNYSTIYQKRLLC